MGNTLSIFDEECERNPKRRATGLPQSTSAGTPTGYLYAHTHYKPPIRNALLINCITVRRALSLDLSVLFTTKVLLNDGEGREAGTCTAGYFPTVSLASPNLCKLSIRKLRFLARLICCARCLPLSRLICIASCKVRVRKYIYQNLVSSSVC